MLAFFVISTHLGGAERSLLDLVTELKKSQRDFLVVVPKDHGPLINKLNEKDIAWKVFPLPDGFLGLSRKKMLSALLLSPLAFLQSFRVLKDLNAFLRENAITTIHSTGLKFHILLALYCRNNPQIQLVIHLRDLISNALLRRFFYGFKNRKHFVWLANSQATAQSVPQLPCHIVYNGFPYPKSSHPNDENLKDQLKIDSNVPLVGIVAAIAEWKGQREFIEMAKLLVDQGLPYHFVIVGDEIYDTRGDKGELNLLKKKVSEYKLKDRITFLGFKKNIWPVYFSLDVLVHASNLPEPFGRVIVEAMLCGCPVTASDLGGPREIIKNGQNGLLHIPGNPQSMADNVCKILSEEPLRDQIVTAAKKKSTEFSMDRHLRNIEPFLNLSC